MEHRCVICTYTPNIRINNLDYCNTCFERQLLHKVFKHFKKLPFGSRILLYFDGTFSSLAMAHAISRLKNRNIHKFVVASRSWPEHRDFLKDIGFSCHVDLQPESDVSNAGLCRSKIDPIPKEVIEVGRSLGFDTVVFQADAEMESVIALRSVCDGCGVLETIESYVSGISGVRVENAFGRIKPKEVRYYCYLNKIAGSFTKLGMSSKELVLSRFISKMESKNSLVVFNILNTVKKIVAGKDGIDTSD
ncbi:hypothetical protein EROM_111100 [Encephalitozoon romaleae SJ-2008]|uniref:Uncharacterized protein n=1 Tax=Encephalitozoon romaleae (strain SJ-2008) TaxID=1178016 RepID=I7AUD5_ENCRO|nr:hypothetical protein EROM_111100 [Encephalitozoon romaleae SJ-2008]AFN84092.1 hypothetical protein EROM_111100 [Encephalitozoon romaleae SJ-2008]